MIYLITFIFTITFSFFYVRKFVRNPVGGSDIAVSRKKTNDSFERKFKKLFLFVLAVFPIWFITAFRYDVGTDYLLTYVKFFKETQLGYSPYNEPLFQFLNVLFVKLNLNYVWLFAVCGAIINIAVFKLIFKRSAYPVLSIALYFCAAIFFNTLNNVRQFLAISIAAFAFFKDRNWKSVLIIAIACLFHFSAVFFLPIWLFSKIRLKRRGFAILTLITLLFTPLFAFGLLKVLANTRYGYFINYSSGFSILTVLINVIIYLFVLFYYDKNDSRYQILANIQVISLFLCLCSVFIQNEEFWMRFIRMTTFFHMLLLPQIVRKEKSKKWRFYIGTFFILMYLGYTVYTVYMCGGLDVIPYKFIF